MAENNTTSCSSDMPAIVDKLGTEEQQRGLVEFMKKCGTPMTIAVQGDWGTGKTSTMKQLQEKLKRENGSTLWFPTWQFAVLGEQDRLLIDLLMLLCCKLEEKCSKFDNDKDKETLNKVTRFIKRVGRAAAIGSIYLAAETGKKLTGIDGVKVVDKVIDEFEKQDKENKSGNTSETNITYESYVIQVSELHNDLTTLIDIYLGRNNTNRLYIFIDDLDRLEPLRAVELLEGIKNFLDIPRCVFVIAIDTKVVMEGLKAKYGENMDKDKMVHFFDKIIQVPYKLPVHNYILEAFMKDVLEGYDEKNAAKYVEFLESADIHNPRTIKRCVNFCLLHKYIDSKENELSSDEEFCLHLFAVKMLELEHEDIYNKLLTGARTYGEAYTDLKAWLLVEGNLKLDLFNKVLKCFEIDDNADDAKVKLFADYIILSAPAKLIEEEQNVKDFRGKDLSGENLSKKNLSRAKLIGVDLSGANLRRANLSYAYLNEADLSVANLNEANLRRANLREANLREADLFGAKLIGADLSGAKLIAAILSYAYLNVAVLYRADLREADLSGADLSEADLREAELLEADLSEADLREADLREAYLFGADLRNAVLREADLREADLREADLSGADLSEADLREADLREADLSGADLSGADLSRAKYCRNLSYKSKFPEGFNPEENGMIEVDYLGIPIKQTMTDEQSETQPIAPL